MPARRAWTKGVAAAGALPAAACLLEVALRMGGSPWLGALLALSLGGCVGGALVLLVRSLGRFRFALAALHGLVPALLYTEVIWAINRFADLSWWSGTISVWTAALAIAAAVSAATHVLLRRVPIARWLGVTIASAIGASCLAFALETLQGQAHTLARFVPHSFVLGFAALLLWPRLERFTLVAGALAGIAALQIVPTRYLELVWIFSALSLTCSAAALRAWGVIPSSRPSPAALTAVSLIVVVLAFITERLVSDAPQSWSESRGHGLMTGLVIGGQRLTDFDRDTHGMIFAQSDCRPFDPKTFPGAHEIPGNDADENCSGTAADASAADWVRAHEAKNPRPARFRGDIVLVLVDTLRYDAAMDPKLPVLSALAKGGLTFTRAYSPSSFTSFVLTGLLGGKLASSVQMHWLGKLSGVPAKPLHGLVPRLRTLGYDTALAGGATPDQNEYFLDNTFGEGFRVKRTVSMHAPAELVEQAAIEAWDALSTTAPRFLYVHFLSVHDDENDRTKYMAAVRAADRAIGRLRAHVGNDALWIVTSDHGTEFGEHGGFFHASTLYDELVHVPLLIAYPGAPPRTIESVSPLRSLMPTLVAMVEPPDPAHRLGPYLCVSAGPCEDLPVPMALELEGVHLHGLVIGHSKIIHDLGRETITAFDLGRDPEEKSPLRPVPAPLLHALHDWEERLFGASRPEYTWPYEAAPR